jgi:hypothetical protein
MIRNSSSREDQQTTSRRLRASRPRVTNRSSRGWGSSRVSARGSSKTVAASAKSTRCLHACAGTIAKPANWISSRAPFERRTSSTTSSRSSVTVTSNGRSERPSPVVALRKRSPLLCLRRDFQFAMILRKRPAHTLSALSGPLGSARRRAQLVRFSCELDCALAVGVGLQAAVRRFSRRMRGCRAAILSRASAGPSGLRRSCSQLRRV